MLTNKNNCRSLNLFLMNFYDITCRRCIIVPNRSYIILTICSNMVTIRILHKLSMNLHKTKLLNVEMSGKASIAN